MMMKNILTWIAFCTLFSVSISGCALISAAGLTSRGLPTPVISENLNSSTTNSSVHLDHNAWTILLKKHVDSQGNVDYNGFKKDQKELTAYLNYLSANKPNATWSEQELLAYYINVYNAFTVQLIVQNYPVKSIKDIDDPWTKAIVPIGNIKMSLGGIETSILKKMKDPRFHFAINCASVSCPKLVNEAYTAASINEQLDKAASAFINSEENKITESKAELSSIFDWYAKDFTSGSKKSVIQYINMYSSVKINLNATVTYLDYNWNLNEKN